jgi:hypothetical protein
MYHFVKMIPNRKFLSKVFVYPDLQIIFAVRKGGAIAQSVEQWTENPCVLGSIPSGTTTPNHNPLKINDLRGVLNFLLTGPVTDFVKCI